MREIKFRAWDKVNKKVRKVMFSQKLISLVMDEIETEWKKKKEK